MNLISNLLDSEVAELMKKITIAVRVQLDRYYNGTPAWTATEIARQFGFPNNRQSEIINPAKYPDTVVSKPLIRKLIAGGFITVKQIENTVTLNDRERIHLQQLAIHEDKDLHDALVTATEAGCSLEDITKVIRDMVCSSSE